jgi:hypothetical protein
VASDNGKRSRSTLPQAEARRHYVELGELLVLEQIEADARLLDQGAMAVGPFARLDASAVAGREGKTRGAISNLFGSQAAFQAATMELALGASDWIEQIKYPDPADFSTHEAWIAAFFDGQSARGPAHAADPAVSYAALWSLWLSAVPYGLWSERISRPSVAEWVQWVARLEEVLAQALRHFDLTLREGTTPTDLACAVASLIEGVWLNQCLTTRHPARPSEPIAAMLRRAGLMLWRGAVAPRG